MQTLLTGGSLIQGHFPGVPRQGSAPLRNLEAVLLRARGAGRWDLEHRWRDQNVPDRPWQVGSVVTSNATGPGAICQRTNKGDVQGNFEVVVPESGGLAHYWLDNSVSGLRSWNGFGLLAPGSTGPGAVLENNLNGNLEVIVAHHSDLVHYWFDRIAWRAGSVITRRASGAPAMIQSDYNGHLEVVVPEGEHLVLYWLDWTQPPRWRRGGVITLNGEGPSGFAQGRYGNDPHRNFEVVVPRGDVLAAYWRDNSLPEMPWRSAGVATWGASPVLAASLCSSDRGGGWLEAFTQEGTSVYHLHRYALGVGLFRWIRSACLRLDDTSPSDVDATRPRSSKLAQVTGEPDAQTGRPTLSLSRSRSGIHGTDLGVAVQHGRRTLLLFGDTHWDDRSRVTLDSIAEVVQSGQSLPNVLMHGSPLQIIGGQTTDREYDVPLDAFSGEGHFFAFFSSNHFDDGKVMGRSVLTRALDPSLPINPQARNRPLQFRFLSTFSDYRFINVSIRLVPERSVPGLGGPGQALLVWGSGSYRADDLRLAVIPLSDPVVWSYLVGDRPFPIHVLGTRYFVGLCGNRPIWSMREEDARPLFFPAALGEISVRWVPEVNRYVLLAMAGTDDPIGHAVWLRTARQPWGPWSNRRQVLDWIVDGMGIRNRMSQFIHNHSATPPDHVGDCIFPEQCNGGGAAYAPYLFDARRGGQTIVLRYVLSTWNPYQAMLMRHDVTIAELDALERL